MIELKEKGVYKITCKPTNKVYIGSTSQSFIKRFWQHEYELLKNTSTQKINVNIAIYAQKIINAHYLATLLHRHLLL